MNQVRISQKTLVLALVTAGFVPNGSRNGYQKGDSKVIASDINLVKETNVDTPFGTSHSPALTNIGTTDNPVIAYSANGTGDDLVAMDAITAAASFESLGKLLGAKSTWSRPNKGSTHRS